MKRFSLKKLILIVFVLLFLLIAYSFFSGPARVNAPEASVGAGVAEQTHQETNPSPAQAPDDRPDGNPSQAPALTPEPTEVPDLVITDTFEVELEETESIGGF